MSAIKQRFNRLLDRVMDGGAIPLLGAGVSMSALSTEPDFAPTLDWMKKRLLDVLHDSFLDRHFPTRYGNAKSNLLVETLLLYKPRDTNGFEQYKRSNYYYRRRKQEISFDKLAEIFSWLHDREQGQRALCQRLNIDKFAELRPAPAHCYLAYLTREGLVPEIFTTNYDTCLERAWLGSFESEADVRNSYHVITTLRSYRLHGGRRWIENSGKRQPVLLLYKLNGCAGEYKLLPDDNNKYDNILLTERQLQSNDSHPWKKDLLKDRLRSHSLLLCGFGSEEPQVRFLSLELFTEFQRNSHTSLPLEETLALPNAPYIAIYDKPSFPQMQVMEGFLLAHEQAISHEGAVDDNNLFCGKDAASLGDEGGKLTADFFFERLFQGAYRRLLKRYWGRGSFFYAWLEAYTLTPLRWTNYLEQKLYAEDAARPLHSLFGKPYWQELLAINHTMGPGPIPFMRLVRCILPPGRFSEDTNWYLPLADCPLTLPALLLLLHLFDFDAKEDFSSFLVSCVRNCRPGGGIVIPYKLAGWEKGDKVNEVFIHLTLVHRRLADERRQLEQPCGSRLAFSVTIPDLDGLDIERRWVHRGSKYESSNGVSMQGLTVGRERNIPFSWLIHQLASPERLIVRKDGKPSVTPMDEVLLKAVEEDYSQRPARKRLKRVPINI